MKITTVIATRDFTVGYHHTIIIRKGEKRKVDIDDKGQFYTHTNENNFFGVCNVKDGWRKE